MIEDKLNENCSDCLQLDEKNEEGYQICNFHHLEIFNPIKNRCDYWIERVGRWYGGIKYIRGGFR